MEKLEVYFVLKGLAPDAVSAVACAGGVACLDHKVFDYSMEGYVIVVAFLCKSDKVLYRLGCFFGEKSDLDITHCGLYGSDGLIFFEL